MQGCAPIAHLAVWALVDITCRSRWIGPEGLQEKGQLGLPCFFGSSEVELTMGRRTRRRRTSDVYLLSFHSLIVVTCATAVLPCDTEGQRMIASICDMCDCDRCARAFALISFTFCSHVCHWATNVVLHCITTGHMM